jgi:tetratricopeptide (TPR) repeat protein
MSRRSYQIKAFFERGERLHAAGRLVEAEQIYRQILAAAPGHAETLHALGALALQAGQPEAAVELTDQAIARKPSAALYHVTRANALLAQGRYDAAIEACRLALRYKRNSAEALQTLGHALSDAGNMEEALAAYQNAMRLQPNLPDLRNNIGATLRHIGRLEAAEGCLRDAQRAAPGDTLVMTNLSSVLKELGQAGEAELWLREALRQQPNAPAPRYNLALLLLLTGRFAEGWEAWEVRFAAGAVPRRSFAQPVWDGAPLRGRTLLVYSEQGLGDTIQFCRYVPLLPARVVFEVQPRMKRLLRTLPGSADIIAAGDDLPPTDLVCPLMSLPRLLGTSFGTVPYLSAEAERVEQWRQRLGGSGLKVGIAWQGNPSRHEDKGRSIDLREFLPLMEIPDIRLISLQRDDGLDQLGTVPGLRVETPGEDFDAGPDAFVDTAAVMASLDLVITSDTAIAHLAGAMGRPVWVALRAVPDWRWMLGCADSPWYPTMRLFRQATRDDWAPVFAQMAQELARMR